MPSNSQIRVLPPEKGAFASSPTIVNGRSYTPVAGSFIDALAADGDALAANGWTFVSLVGPTADRPAASDPSPGRPVARQRGVRYLDTDVGAQLVYDGASWRNVLTGAAA